MSPYEFYQEAVKLATTRCDELGEKLERAYVQLDSLDAQGADSTRVGRMVRLLEQQEDRAVEQLEFFVAKRREYRPGQPDEAEAKALAEEGYKVCPGCHIAIEQEQYICHWCEEDRCHYCLTELVAGTTICPVCDTAERS